MNNFIKICGAALIIFSAAVIFSKVVAVKTLTELDRDILKAYNNNPRNTADVYANSILILTKTGKEESPANAAWQLKAKKLVTVACYYECTQAIDRKLYRQAFIWAKRGEKNGTASGKIGDVPVKNLYDYLSFASKELQETVMVKNSNPEELSQQIDNHDAPAEPQNTNSKP
jgi:hypothetical protein